MSAARRAIVVGRRARPSADFSLDDLPSSSGRLDVLLRCLRAALCVSHGLRADAAVDLVLLGGASPRVVRVDGARAKFVRPDERSLALLVRKSLAAFEALDPPAEGFVEVRPGVSVARGGVERALEGLGGPLHLLDEGGEDARAASLGGGVFVLGDDLGPDDETRARLARLGARALSVGPVSLHAEDALAVLWNELDRRASGA